MMPRGDIDAELSLPEDPALSRREAVYQCLQAAILTGAIAPGTVLSELALAEHLGTSRTPVHDALRELTNDGLVEQQSRRRAVVATVSGRDVENIFDMRIILECAACERAAERIDRHSVETIRAQAEELAQAAGDDWHERWVVHDSAFHQVIAEACGNPLLAADIGRYHRLHRGLNRYRADAALLRPAASEHVAIAAALLQRDGPAAAAAMRRHLMEWRAAFASRIVTSER